MSRREYTEPARPDRRARRSPTIAPPAPVPAAAPDPARGHVLLDEPVVAALQGVRDYPCASVLMSTAPGRALSTDDSARLDRLPRRPRGPLRSGGADPPPTAPPSRPPR